MDDLLAAPADQPVLIGKHGETCMRELRRNAATVAAALPAAAPGSFVAFAFEHDRAAFAAALLGAWARGHGTALPADARRQSVVPAMSRPDVRVLVHDLGAGIGLDVAQLLAKPPAAEHTGVPLHLHGELRAHTAPAGGDSAERRWPASELMAACAATAEQLALPAGACVWNAFRPANPHALLPGLLAPLRCGARVAGGPLAGEEQLAALLAAAGAHTLVAPASLVRAFARRPAPPALKQPALPALKQVVAADEPLDARTIERLAAIGVRNVPAASVAPGADDRRRLDALHALLAHDDVTDAAVEVIGLPDGQHAFCVVAAPDQLEEALRRALPTGTPATMLFVDRLPRDPDGALHRTRLLRLFGRDAGGRAPSNRLLFRELRGDGARTFRTQVPGDFYGFEGHFEGYPVLSAAVQLHELVLPCVRAVLGEVAAAGFQDLKFLARIAPVDTVDVTIRCDAARGTCDFEIRRGDVKCSTGRMSVRSAGAEAGQ